MAVRFCHMGAGATFGIAYVFERRGEGLPMHAHAGPNAHLQHSVACLVGTVMVRGPDWRQRLEAGQDLVFDSGQPHEIAALTDGAAVLNLFDRGQPAAYASLPARELAGIAEMGPLTQPIEGDPHGENQPEPAAAQ